ncbi:hypothetical protein B0O80DRAFT_450243 [Mortierella sp. GBAus27b]|nr:hypothetical protein B0O80DRAFT_450243 [Mortierella sp. GBAus27b]
MALFLSMFRSCLWVSSFLFMLRFLSMVLFLCIDIPVLVYACFGSFPWFPSCFCVFLFLSMVLFLRMRVPVRVHGFVLVHAWAGVYPYFCS